MRVIGETLVNNDGTWLHTQLMEQLGSGKPFVYVELRHDELQLDMVLEKREAMALADTLRYFASQIPDIQRKVHRGPTYIVKQRFDVEDEK